MANEMPNPDDFTGLARKVLQYSQAFAAIVEGSKQKPLEESDWQAIEMLVNTGDFQRQGVFLGPQAELIDWATYKHYVSQYAAGFSWEGTLRHITESGQRVILELEERNTGNGETDVSNTVTTYEFDGEEKLCRLEVYVMPLEKR
jgi:hypothetical protein